MISHVPDEISHGIRRRHATAAMTSAGISAVLHTLFWIWLLTTPFQFSWIMPTLRKHLRPEPKPHTMTLREVRPDEWQKNIAEALGGSGDVEDATAVGVDGGGLLQQVSDLAVPPESARVEPAPLPAERLGDVPLPVEETRPKIERQPMQPRQEVMAVEKAVAQVELPGYERKRIPKVERVPMAADISIPADRDLLDAVATEGGATLEPGDAASLGLVTSGPAGRRGVRRGDRPEDAGAGAILRETGEAVTKRRSLDNFLKARVFVYSGLGDGGTTYFRLEVSRIDDKVLPVLPKDVLFVQDCSASLAEQRLYFCRQALARSLTQLRPQDRFNIVKFNQTPELCFKEWTPVGEESILKAVSFIGSMQSVGDTDILRSIQQVLSVARTPGRPLIAVVVTDGLATAGTTDASAIIREFSRSNAGAVSVFTLGTMRGANKYLIDMLSYCNRGDSRIVQGGRWSIPETIESVVKETSQPVLTDVAVRFAEESGGEVYPVQTMNLYSDRALVLFGRCPKGTKRLVFQAVGRAGEIDCDMIFSLDLEADAKPGDKGIRTDWAVQKVYHLIGEYARTQDAALIDRIYETAGDYRVRIPHRGEF